MSDNDLEELRRGASCPQQSRPHTVRDVAPEAGHRMTGSRDTTYPVLRFLCTEGER